MEKEKNSNEKEKSKNNNVAKKATTKSTDTAKSTTKTSTAKPVEKTSTTKATTKKSTTKTETKTSTVKLVAKTSTAKSTSTAKATKKNTAKSNVKSNKTGSADTKKKSTTKKSETTKKVTAKNVPVQQKTVTKNKEIKEQEELIAHVESVSEQAKIYEDLLEHNLLDENEEVSEELVDPKVFKDNELETIRKELKNNKKSNNSKSKKQEKYKEIFKNSLIFIFIELYFLILLISKSTTGTIEYITDLKVFVLIEMVVSIILFEISYKKDNSKIAWHGIEMALLGATTVLILDLYSRQSSIIDTVFAIIAGAFIIYYVIKMFIIALKKQK